MVDIPDKIDHEIGIYKAKNGLTSKDQAMIMALFKFFKVKFTDIKSLRNIRSIKDRNDVKIN